MKSRSEVWLKALEDFGDLCSVSTHRDAETVRSRIAAEGSSFFTMTLPIYGKEFERTLATRRIPRESYVGWRRQKVSISAEGRRSTSRPLGPPSFLGGFQNLLFYKPEGLCLPWYSDPSEYPDDELAAEPSLKFDRGEDGSVLCFEHTADCWCIERAANAVTAIRQLTLMFAKEKNLCSTQRQADAVLQYKATDEELDYPLRDAPTAFTLFEDGRLARIRRVFTALYAPVLSEVDRMIYENDLTPAHGPGATADRLRGNQKWCVRTWTERLEEVFPHRDYLLPNLRFSSERSQVTLLPREREIPAKVSLVPKTQATPRLIAIEPTCMQYMQQAVARPLVRLLETDYLPQRRGRPSENLASLFLGFSEQWPNRAMAQIGSEDGSLATLDLSEASDRVANWLVEDLFGDFPWFLQGIEASRSTRARLPSGEVIPLLKFASMGSALTFPIEAMVFLAIVMERLVDAAIPPGEQLALKRAVSSSRLRNIIRSFRDQVRVYGDDIIVPTDMAETVIDGLELCGFKVNRNKSFWTGGFRESCGKEYWFGHDVSIVRVREALPTSRRDATEIVSAVSTRNQFYRAGLHRVVRLYDEMLEGLLPYGYPIVEETSSVLGRLSDHEPPSADEWDDELHVPLVKGYVVKARPPVNQLDGPEALLKCLIGVSTEMSEDHLMRSGRPRVVGIKRAKRPPF